MEPLTVQGTLDALGAVGQYVMAAAEEAKLSRPTAYKLRLAVDEIVTNIMVHGYQETGATGTIRFLDSPDEVLEFIDGPDVQTTVVIVYDETPVNPSVPVIAFSSSTFFVNENDW